MNGTFGSSDPIFRTVTFIAESQHGTTKFDMPRTRHAALLGALFVALCTISLLQADCVPATLATADAEGAPDYLKTTSGRGNADLIIDYISASWTTSEAGETEYVSVRIENIGTDSSGSFYWGIYLSTDTTITTSDIELDTYYKSSISAGSSSSTYSKSVQIPTTITGGRYYVGALADINNQVSESDENNNDKHDTGRVTIDEQPDLTGRSCSGPTTGVVGDYLDSSISLSIENDPGGNYIASSGTFYWAMYLSTDSTITSSDTQVGSDQYKSSISGGSYSSDSLSTSNRIPSSMNPGTYYWGYLLDVRTDVDEQNENNNDYTCNQITVEDDLPDIVADDVGTSTSSVVMGDTISVTYRLENDGNDYTGSFYWELYLSTDRTITTSDILVDEFSRSSISPGYYYSGTQYSVQIPTGINPGYYYLGMIADSRTSVTELDETNNVVADTGRLDVEEQADLVPGTPSGPNSAYTGDQVSLSWRIDNDGDDSAGWFYWKAYLSTDRTITSSDTQVGSTQQVSSISGGSYRSGSLSVTIPSSLSSRTYYWGIIADTTDRVDEGDESNNADDGNSISITVADPDLRADYVSVNSATQSICEQGTVTIDLDVSNQGNVNANSHYYDISFSTSGSFGSWTSIGQGNGPGGVSSYSHQVSGGIPASMTAGTYYARLYVDPYDYISESDEFNNDIMTSSAQLTVLDCTPDLSPTTISGPTSTPPGATVQVSYGVENLGVQETTNVAIDIFLSRDTTITSSDTHLGATTAASIQGGTTHSDSLSLTIPSNIGSGCWYWGIIADMNDNIAEKLETNNALASSSQVCIDQPNLRIVSVSNPSSALLGQTVDVTVIIENIGASNSMAFSVELKLSVESPSGHSDILLDTFQVNSLNSQTNSEIVRTVQLPSSPAGTYHLYAIADTSGVITESDETDNQKSSSSFNINAPTTDLLALAISGPSGAEPEQTVEISWGVRNLGADPLSFEIEIWLSGDKSLDGNDKIVRSQSLDSLEGGGTHTANNAILLTAEDEGTWWLLLVIDSKNTVFEDDEGNNLAVSSSQITIAADAPPPIVGELTGCESPNDDGDFGSDAAGTRASATHLGVDPESITIEGCLVNDDVTDWYAVVLHGGKQLAIALEGEGAVIEVELLNGTTTEANGAIGPDSVLVTLGIRNDDDTNDSRLYNIKVTRDAGTDGGAYLLRILTVNGTEAPDLEPPNSPELLQQNDWTSADNITLEWQGVEDNGNSGLSHYETRWAGGLWAPIEGNSTTLNISMLADGRHSLEVRAVDNASNPSAASAVWVKIDRTAPELVIEQIGAQYAGPPVLEIGIEVNDGSGSGVEEILWSWDNQTWMDMPANGAIIWSNWSDTDLYVKVVDKVGMENIQNLTIAAPPNPNQPTEDEGSEESRGSGGASTQGIAAIILIALLLGGLAAAGLYLVFRGRSIEEEEDEFETDEEPVVEVHEPLIVTRVESHEDLPTGGTYDQSTGVTWYFALDGGKWWLEPDGSFHLASEEIPPQDEA